MKSFLAAGATIALSLWCTRVEADFPQSMLGPQAPNWGTQLPTYGTQPYAVPNSSPAQSFRPNVPAYGATPSYQPTPRYQPTPSYQPTPTYQPAPTYQPTVPYVATAPQNDTPAGSGVANDTAPASGAPVYSYEAGAYEQAMGAPTWCGPAPAPAASGCPTWFGGIYGLVMTRDREENSYMFTSDTDPSRLYMPSSAFGTDYVGGNEARIGRTFDCCKWGLEFVYWGLPSSSQSAVLNAVDVTGVMRSTIDYSSVWGNFPAQAQLTDVTDSLTYARVRRREEFHNAEVNLLSGPLTLAPSCGAACGGACGAGGCGTAALGYTPGYFGGRNACCGPRWVANWVFGFRFFKFDEDLRMFMDRDDNVWGSTDYEIYHDIDIENNLYGFQLGTDINYCLTKCFHLDFGSKFGVYGNHSTQLQKICSPQGLAYVLPAASEDYWVDSSEDEVAFLGELRAGFGFKVGCHFRFTGGYRAVAVSGVATTLGQLNEGRTLGRLAYAADIDSDDSLILHGAYAGTEFAW